MFRLQLRYPAKTNMCLSHAHTCIRCHRVFVIAVSCHSRQKHSLSYKTGYLKLLWSTFGSVKDKIVINFVPFRL